MRRKDPMALRRSAAAALFAIATCVLPACSQIGSGGGGGSVSFSYGMSGAALKGLPFSAEFVSQTVQTLSDGTHITHQQKQFQARDSEGRTRNEMYFPDSAGADPRSGQLLAVIIMEPAGGQFITSAPSRRQLSQYPLEALIFEGARLFSPEQLKDVFYVPIGDKVNRTALGKGLEGLRQLYGDHGYFNFTAVPALELDKDRGAVVMTISIHEGTQFTFGQLFLAGQETRAGQADTLRNAWAALSGKRYDSSLLRKWLAENATFLPNDGQPLRHVEQQLDSSTHQADLKLTFP
jgi:Surface antigen variable number repeat